MIQGGDPTGTGTGGESYFGGTFEDECSDPTKRENHTQKGCLSMANKGPDTNSSQFFLTFAPCPHLDGKHTVFGKLTQGFDILSKIEKLPTDSKNRPINDITILSTTILKNPFRDTISQILAKDHKIVQQKKSEELQQ